MCTQLFAVVAHQGGASSNNYRCSLVVIYSTGSQTMGRASLKGHRINLRGREMVNLERFCCNFWDFSVISCVCVCMCMCVWNFLILPLHSHLNQTKLLKKFREETSPWSNCKQLINNCNITSPSSELFTCHVNYFVSFYVSSNCKSKVLLQYFPLNCSWVNVLFLLLWQSVCLAFIVVWIRTSSPEVQ